MPTKRTKRQPQKVGISGAAVEAWTCGDSHRLNSELGVALCSWSPLDVTDDGPPPPYDKQPWQQAAWRRAQQLCQALLEVAGEPGRYDRHGAPLGPA